MSREERKKEKIKKRMQMTEQGSAEERERKKLRSVVVLHIILYTFHTHLSGKSRKRRPDGKNLLQQILTTTAQLAAPNAEDPQENRWDQ